MNDLVMLYESTRRRARSLPTWRLRRMAHAARRALSRDPLNETRQVQLVAFEQELCARGLLQRAALPPRPLAPRLRLRAPWR